LQGFGSNAPFPNDVWMQVKMATLLCTTSADGSYPHGINIHKHHRKDCSACHT